MTTSLSRIDLGRLVLALDGGGELTFKRSVDDTAASVVPVRAFPLSNPAMGISLVDRRGHEVLWIDDASVLSATSRAALLEALARREFRPDITRIVSVSTFATPSVWQVQTDHGVASLVLKAEEDIRRLGPTRLLITSASGVCFEIKNRRTLDRPSRRLLERFL